MRRTTTSISPAASIKVDQKTWAACYIQDNYKVNSRLTLTPGLRWDINPALNDAI